MALVMGRIQPPDPNKHHALAAIGKVPEASEKYVGDVKEAAGLGEGFEEVFRGGPIVTK